MINELTWCAAFLTSLRTNLYLSTAAAEEPWSASPSLTNTPDSIRPTMTSSTGSLPPPSPFQPPLSPSNDQLSSIPSLTTYAAVSEEDQILALRLVADGVAQQRQFAAKSLIFHPAVVAGWIAILAVVAQFLYKGQTSDLALVATTWAGSVMAGLLLVRWLTGGYLEMAEKVGTWNWLYKDGRDIEMIITKFGENVIGALIMRIGRSDSSPTSRGNRAKKKNTAVIRAWAVAQRYRGKGVGGGLLEEAVRISKERGCIPSFAADHANAGRILPAMFNKTFERREQKAQDMLETVIDESNTKGRKPKR